jgi:hypothetical protein
MLPNNYNKINNYFNKSTAPYNYPNYIPVNNYADFTIDVYTYYNQYYASPKTTQNRRIMRNYLNNQSSIKQFNQNPFKNNKGKLFYFFNSEIQSYMVIEYTTNLIPQKPNGSLDVFILINSHWCLVKHVPDKNSCKEFENFLKRNAVQKPYFV